MSDTFSPFPIMHHSFQSQLPPHQVTTPHLPPPFTHSQLPPHQVTSPHLTHSQLPPYQVTSPHLTHSQLPPHQVTSPHLPPPPASPVHPPHYQVNPSPLPPQPHETLFYFPHPEAAPPQALLLGADPGTDFPPADWACGPPCFLDGDGLDLQNQTPGLLDQSPGDAHTHYDLGQDPWAPAELSPAQLCCPTLGGWSFTEDFHDLHFFNDAPPPFYSPTTPGPSPHYPPPSALLSAAPQMAGGGVLHPQQAFDCPPMEPRQQLVQRPGSFPEPDHHPSGRLGATPLNQDLSRPGFQVGPDQTEDCSGGAEPGMTWNKVTNAESRTEVLDTRLLCLVCNRDFRSLPALNGHMRSHSGFRELRCVHKDPSTSSQGPVVMPVTVPVQSQGASKAWRRGQKRFRTGGGGALYHSLMQPDEEEEQRDGGHFVPPPMLSPLRPGPGLFCSLTTRGQKRARTVKLRNGLNDLDLDTVRPKLGTLTARLPKPRINVGPDFQADIPPLQPEGGAGLDSHHALVLWTPRAQLEHPAAQQRVEALLRMVRSSVVAGGGASPEDALRVLSESSGDFLLTTEKLLSAQKTSDSGDLWSTAETRLLVQSLQVHQKNFSLIQKAVKTKSVSQCVEFYYRWKRRRNLSVALALPEAEGQRS